jgi:hypothetical protein
MTTSEPENKNISDQPGQDPVPRLFFASSESRRSFFDEMGSGDFEGSGPCEPVYLGSFDPKICDNTVNINKDFGVHFEPVLVPEKGSRITAIVQSIFSDVKTTIFDLCGTVFGSAKKSSSENCGKVRAKIMCTKDPGHFSYYKHERCNNPDCPTCYSKFAHRLADGIVSRVRGYMGVYPDKPVSHVVLWPHVLTGYRNMAEAFADAHRMLIKLGSVASVVWYHPYRIRGDIKAKLRRYRKSAGIPDGIGFWEMAHDDVLGLGGLEPYVVYGPHFHVLTTGYLMNALDYSKLGLGGYKKVRRISSAYDLERVCYYLSTHTCWEPGHQAVRYYGEISYSKLAKGYPRETIVDVVCLECGNSLVEYYCNDDGVLNGLAHGHVTQKVVEYMYWKRGVKPRVPIYQEFQAALPSGVGVDDTKICLDCGQVMHKHESFDRGYKYRFTCANANCCKAADFAVWYDSSDRVTTPPLKSGLGSKL